MMDPAAKVKQEFERAEVARMLGGLPEPDPLWSLESAALEGHLREGTRVLDIGCGEGREARGLVRRGAQVVGGDLSIAMLRRGRPLLAGVPLVVLDAGRLPFRDGAFDIVFLPSMLIQYVWPRAARHRAQREAFRVLTPGGTALFHILKPGLAEDLLGCRAPVPVRRGLRIAFGACTLGLNLLTDLARTVFRTRLEPGDRWCGRGILSYYHMYTPTNLEREARAVGFEGGTWFRETTWPGPSWLSALRDLWNGQNQILAARRPSLHLRCGARGFQK